MAKRFAIIFFITIGSVLFILTSTVLVMFLAPGAEILGLRYITTDSHPVKKNIDLSYTYGDDFNGSMEVYANEIQINVCFYSGLQYKIEYYDNYSGVTDSKNVDPDLDLELKEDGSLQIKVQEYNTVIFRSSNTIRYLNIYIPIDFVSVVKNADKLYRFDRVEEFGNSKAYETDLKIYTKSSLIKFEQDKFSSYIPTFRTLRIETDGQIDTEGGQIKCLNYELSTGNSVEISSYPGTRINALNYDIVAGGSIKFYSVVSGNISAESKHGDILFTRCVNFKARTDIGRIGASTADGTRILGTVDIATYSGNVNINNIEGSGTSKIETVSGDVVINKVENASSCKVSSRRGFVSIGNSKNVEIVADIGTVRVDEATQSLNIKTIRGKVFAGSEEKEINNLTVETVLGAVEAKNVVGEVSVKTAESNANVIGKAITQTNIDVGGSLYISGVAGATNITVQDSAEIWFKKDVAISAETNITAGSGCKNLVVYLPGNSIERTRYVIDVASVNAYFANEQAFETFTKRDGFAKNNSPTTPGVPLLKITGESADLSIYFKSR